MHIMQHQAAMQGCMEHMQNKCQHAHSKSVALLHIYYSLHHCIKTLRSLLQQLDQFMALWPEFWLVVITVWLCMVM